MTIVAGPKAQVRSLLGGRYNMKSREQMVLTLGSETYGASSKRCKLVITLERNQTDSIQF